MGTNYYHHPTGERDCPHCGQQTPSRHIGKSSGGWNFSLRVYLEDGIASLADWQAVWAEGGKIFNEYGDEVEATDMLAVITERAHPKGLRSHVGYRPEGFPEYQSEARYGGPTYDLCPYEFS